MKHKNVFLKSTIILIIGGIFTKILGFINRVLYTRIVGPEIIGLYSLVMPTYSLVITISTFALPTTISKLIAERKNNNTKIIFNSVFIILIVNTLLMIVLLLSSKYIATNLLKEKDAYYLLIAIALTFPIISVSSIIKGYFYGKQNMVPNALSNVIEEIVRGVLICLVVPKCLEISHILAAASLFFITFVEEVISIIVNLLFLPNNILISKRNIVPDKLTINDILNISIPTVSSRLIGNIGYFFEPIIITNLLLFTGFSNNYILIQYGAFNAYTITLLTVPSFFITAISSSLIPEISKYYLAKNKVMIIKRLKEAICFSLLIGLSFTITLFIFGEDILYLLYKTKEGLVYLKILNPIFPLFYIEAILISFMQAINKAKRTMIITIIGVIIKLLSLIILSLLHLGMYSLVISEIINIILVVSLNIIYTNKYLKEL